MYKMKVLSFGIGTFLTAVGIMAIYVGIGLIIDPSGLELGMNVHILENSPFNDFLLPGIALLLINGICSLLVASAAFNFHNYAGALTMLLGAIMLTGGATQFYWIGWVSWVHSTFIVIGIVEIGFGYILYVLQKENFGSFRKNYHSDFH